MHYDSMIRYTNIDFPMQKSYGVWNEECKHKHISQPKNNGKNKFIQSYVCKNCGKEKRVGTNKWI